MAAAAGYWCAAGRQGNGLTFVLVMLAAGLTIAGGCVLNNVIDRRIDKAMARTKQRALVTGKVSVLVAICYGSLLCIAGVSILAAASNWLAVAVGLAGLAGYVGLYAVAKRRTIYGTIVGSLPGAVPLVVGYLAFRGVWDTTASLLFVVMMLWQLPHFYAIAIYRRAEYANAVLPVYSVVKGVEATRRQIIGATLLFVAAAIGLGLVSGPQYLYLLLMSGVCGLWLYRVLLRPAGQPVEQWARQVFGTSLIVLLVWCVALPLQSLLLV